MGRKREVGKGKEVVLDDIVELIDQDLSLFSFVFSLCVCVYVHFQILGHSVAFTFSPVCMRLSITCKKTNPDDLFSLCWIILLCNKTTF